MTLSLGLGCTYRASVSLSQVIVLARGRMLAADPGSDMSTLLRYFRRQTREGQGVLMLRNTDDEGGGGLTYINGLVAMVEGAAQIIRRRTIS